ncbi:tryptophan synthase beta subunit-like PLP-dependent enzyme [Microthyrium microscopicum]|uniref:L-serine ammonia-lyase n=1 Tax=Microthyrium microscopicum TaxID=703497 RepID=A0A6A6UI09_9PEZI|nr:tryptophan synthase beta subunit-like PLP-dependent enzyme [Microthyrium microscopicum]
MAIETPPTAPPPKLWRKTPLIESRTLSNSAGCRIHLKLENHQPSGSFKSRGIGSYMLSILSSRSSTSPTPHFYSSSGGNAGLACVAAALTLGCPASVVVPLSTKPLMIEKIKAAGASQVLQHGKSWQEADDYLRQVVLPNDKAGVYVPPFDAPAIWAGHGTLVTEVVEQLGGVEPQAVVCSVGGGGLFCGIVRALEERGSQTSVVAVETKGAESLAESLKAGEVVTLKGISSQATSLGAVRVAEEAWRLAKSERVHSVVLDDREAERGCVMLAEQERVMVELACGVNVAMCQPGYLEKALGRPVRADDVVVIVVCGGSNVTIEMLCQWKKDDIERREANGKTGVNMEIIQKKDG